MNVLAGVVVGVVVGAAAWRLLVYFEAEKDYTRASSWWWTTQRSADG